MKRYNRANKKFVLLGLVLPILVFFISYTAVFAYFTSTSRNEIDTSAAIVKIGFKAEEGASKISHEIQTGSTTSSEATIMPGDTLIANATIVNEGNVDVYAIFNFVVNIKKSNGTTEIDVNDFYTFNSDGTVKKLIATNDVYTNEACLMTPNQTIDVSVSKHFKGLFYGNEYKQAQVTYSITAMAIQTVNIGTAVNATNLLINNTNENYSNLQIFGNSIQNGTPSVDTPISIESVGDKTKNLIPTYTPQSKNGLTLDVNNDGSLHIYGTPSENTIFKQEFYNVKPNNYFLSGCPSGGSDSTYRLLAYFKASNYNLIDYGNGKGYKLETESNVVVDLKIYIGQYVDLIFKPMLEVGLTGTEFEPYNKYKIPIQTTTKNLLNVNEVEPGTFDQTTGLPVESAVNQVRSTTKINCKSGDILLQTNTMNNDLRYFFYNEADTLISTAVWEPNKSVTVPNGVNYFKFSTGSSIGANELKLFEYKITRTSTYNIYLDQPLRKIGNYVDYIDFSTCTVVRSVKSIAFTGTENWNLATPETQTENANINLSLSGNDFYCNIGTNDNIAESGENFAIKADNGIIRFYRPFETDIENLETTPSLENWKAWLAERYASGNPIIVEYASKTVTVETIELPNILDYSIDNISVGTSVQAKIINWQ